MLRKFNKKSLALVVALAVIVSLAVSVSAVIYPPSFGSGNFGRCLHNQLSSYAYYVYPDGFQIVADIPTHSIATSNASATAEITLDNGQIIRLTDYGHIRVEFNYWPPAGRTIKSVIFTMGVCDLILKG